MRILGISKEIIFYGRVVGGEHYKIRSFLFVKSCLEEGIISLIQQLRLGQQEFGSVWFNFD